MTNQIPIEQWVRRIATGGRLTDAEALSLAEVDDLPALCRAAAQVRDEGFGDLVSVSRKVFIPLTKLCRDVCHYCTFAHPPKKGERAFLTPEEVLDIARAGAKAGCDEALFTLGDKPELRYRIAREELAELGYGSTVEYLTDLSHRVIEETGLLPHINAGIMTEAELSALREVSVSQGIMLETISDRLSQRGGPHFGSPDKLPAVRLAMVESAGRASVPFTTGILIGIGETRTERIDALLALRTLHDTYGHIQEIIVQNFRAKPGTKMADAPEPTLEDHQWTIAVARLIFGKNVSVQAPPNLRSGELEPLISAGLSDWGGVSPLTPDHVNPEAPWPELERLARETARAGKVLVPRLAIYPAWLKQAEIWLAPNVRSATLKRADGQGYAQEQSWRVGQRNQSAPRDTVLTEGPAISTALVRAIDRGFAGRRLSEDDITALFRARGSGAAAVRAAADTVRREKCGDDVRYVVNRNINYTNVCTYKCTFCAFSKGNKAEHLRGLPYDLEPAEIARRVREAWDRGGTEVCMQGGIHPDYTGDTYLEICRIVKEAVPEMHIHAFSPLEVSQGAHTLGVPVPDFLVMLKEAGLGTLPGTAAEILDEEVRQRLCGDKLSTDEWLAVIEAAHMVGLRSTATIMYGHIDSYTNWARHLNRIRALQEKTGGFTEFVPLPFVHMEAPVYLRGDARQGPSYREAVLMHSVARLALNGAIDNIQVSWVKMGAEGVKAALASGANDLGGTLMNESISRAAGSEFGQEMSPARMEELICSAGRVPSQRSTLYGAVDARQTARSFTAADMTPVVQSKAGKHARFGGAAKKRSLAALSNG
ncbi:5-amino-6-(D-ribitylamino)uracil--L-tyrosine 4-hydroxyphenyl transferase CofH [Leisingera daeponensis]|uniref:5-amino-6-(D-ribitylamino)uracil--L-tyrosine 4-hydroxyphenyl transferase CofH n=1 Tax=Leisingera daeponensis TaxID=405746 RepID=UPI001C951056|nr:5-amino-6-(D-ribitylamino)uracil--L-tyrosine 4-hydroxyphenyl transferase CofH [Leisingera daeponensis]MBY6058767.1 5-amino-6-(D-ribitylamino)uracil--L-tyrosine 4-hydroxyphenyl transferase CofH [Leisingera daeponensis]